MDSTRQQPKSNLECEHKAKISCLRGRGYFLHYISPSYRKSFLSDLGRMLTNKIRLGNITTLWVICSETYLSINTNLGRKT